MINECAKCGDVQLDCHITSGGVFYSLCKACHDQVKDSPTGTLEKLMGPKKESWVERNMREARERRSRGEFLWN